MILNENFKWNYFFYHNKKLFYLFSLANLFGPPQGEVHYKLVRWSGGSRRMLFWESLTFRGENSKNHVFACFGWVHPLLLNFWTAEDGALRSFAKLFMIREVKKLLWIGLIINFGKGARGEVRTGKYRTKTCVGEHLTGPLAFLPDNCIQRYIPQFYLENLGRILLAWWFGTFSQSLYMFTWII